MEGKADARAHLVKSLKIPVTWKVGEDPAGTPTPFLPTDGGGAWSDGIKPAGILHLLHRTKLYNMMDFSVTRLRV